MSKEFHPLVSIVIPVYNGSNYMREAIDSVLAQTYDNIEIIVVNDGSDDNTEEIAKSYGDNIRYFAKKNGGVSTALNMGIMNMRGEYFSWLSHDDLYTPNKIEKNIAALKTEPMRIVYSDYDNVDEKCGYIGTVSAKRLHRAADYEFGLFPIISGLIHGCSLLIHRSQFEKCGLFDEKLRTTQDYDLFFKMFRGQRLIYIPEALVKGRTHQKRTTFTSNKTIPECEILWIGMFESLTHEEMCVIGGSERHFWINQAPFMKEVTPYVKATEYAFKRLKECNDKLCGGLVSIITPFYNRVDMVIRSINSVQQQSYQNWELILINDGSTDNISEIERRIEPDCRIKLINCEHMGVAHARNTGLDVATGKFIAFLDSDDKWEPLKLEKQLKFMIENNYCASHTSYNRIDTSEKFLERVDLSGMQGDVFRYCLYSCVIDTSCVIVEREFWGSLRFPQDVDYGEDVCVWLELAWRGKWGLLPEALTSFCVRENSAFKDRHKQQLGCAEILRYILKKPEWEIYQLEIGIIARNFADMFVEPKKIESLNTAEPLDYKEEEVRPELHTIRRNIFWRLFRALKIYGLRGTTRKFFEKLSR